MTVYYSDLVDSTKVTGGKALLTLAATVGTVSFPSGTALLNGDTVKLFFISQYTRLYELHLDISGALESGTPGITGTVSDGTNVYFVSASKVNGNGDTLTTLLRSGGRGNLSGMGESGMFGVVDYTQDTVMQLNITADGGGAMAAARTIKFYAYTQQV